MSRKLYVEERKRPNEEGGEKKGRDKRGKREEELKETKKVVSILNSLHV